MTNPVSFAIRKISDSDKTFVIFSINVSILQPSFDGSIAFALAF